MKYMKVKYLVQEQYGTSVWAYKDLRSRPRCIYSSTGYFTVGGHVSPIPRWGVDESRKDTKISESEAFLLAI